MKWILRVHRRDPERTVPLVMVDAGKIINVKYRSVIRKKLTLVEY